MTAPKPVSSKRPPYASKADFGPPRQAARALAGALPLVFAAMGCGVDRHTAVDVAMGSAYRPPTFEFEDTRREPRRGGAAAATAPRPAAASDPYQLLAGDFHCHVSPPDWDQEANRDLAGTVRLAKEEHLDFVVLTPHVGARFFTDEDRRRDELEALRGLRDEIARQAPGGPLLVAGFEYTDHRQGHLGFSFADLDRLLARLSAPQLARRPQDFMQGWVDAGGLIVVNHPLVTPLDSTFAIARADLSWRPWTRPDAETGVFPPEIVAAHHLAQAFEAYNLTAAHIRDRYLGPPGAGTYAETLARLDGEILAQQRRIVPLGGSDSHENHLRATTFVLARERTVEGVREAVLAGRVCVRDWRACTLRARVAGLPSGPGSAWQPPGAAFSGADALEIRASGADVRILINGQAAAHPRAGEIALLRLDPDRCSIVRAEIDGGTAAPLYANCAFAR